MFLSPESFSNGIMLFFHSCYNVLEKTNLQKSFNKWAMFIVGTGQVEKKVGSCKNKKNKNRRQA